MEMFNVVAYVTWFCNVFVSCWLFVHFNLFLVEVNFVSHKGLVVVEFMNVPWIWCNVEII